MSLRPSRAGIRKICLLSLQVDDFVSYVTNMSQVYRTNNVLITMGEDFNYQSAHMWFKNLDKLIKYESGMSLTGKFISTPSESLKI